MDTCIMDTCITDSHILDLCITDAKVEKEVLVNFAWVTWPERPKGAKDEVKRSEGPPPRSWGPGGPQDFWYYTNVFQVNICIS